MDKREFIGYHGTTEYNANKIIESQSFRESKKETEWLGHGIYFYDYIYDARLWAEEQAKKKRRYNSIPVVLAADIRYDPDNLLDLNDYEQSKELDVFFKELLKTTNLCNKLIKAQNEEQEQHMKQCLVCDMYCQANQNIQLIKYTFFGRNYRRERSTSVYEKTQAQTCVKDSSIIKNIRKVEQNGQKID